MPSKPVMPVETAFVLLLDFESFMSYFRSCERAPSRAGLAPPDRHELTDDAVVPRTPAKAREQAPWLEWLPDKVFWHDFAPLCQVDGVVPLQCSGERQVTRPRSGSRFRDVSRGLLRVETTSRSSIADRFAQRTLTTPLHTRLAVDFLMAPSSENGSCDSLCVRNS